MCYAPESTKAKNSVLPDRTLTVGRDLHVGSPSTLLICPANRRRAGWLGSRRRALLSGCSTSPRQNSSRWHVGSKGSGPTPLLFPLSLAETAVAAVAAAAAAPGRSVRFLLPGATQLAPSVASHSSSVCFLLSCIASPCVRCNCRPCKRPASCVGVRSRMAAWTVSPANAASSCLRLHRLHRLRRRRLPLREYSGCCSYPAARRSALTLC